MPPFELQLTESDIDPRHLTQWALSLSGLWRMSYPAGVEPVPTRRRLSVQNSKIRADRRRRILMSTKSLQLRVPSVAAGTSTQHSLGEQGLTPAGDEALPVQG